MIDKISQKRYEELGALLKGFYWEYNELNSDVKNDFVIAIEKAFSYADDTFNPYQGKNFDVSFLQNNSAYGAKKFLKIIKKEEGFSKVVSILKKVSQYTSDIRVISMIFLPYIFGKLGVTSLELKLGMSLAVALTCLVIEKSISTKKSKKLNEEIESIKTFLSKEEKLENVEQLTNILDEISDDT